MYYGTEDYMTQLSYNNSQSYGEYNLNNEFMRKLIGNK